MSDSVNHPAHYGGEENPFEAIKVIESLGLGYGFCVGNALKYVMRAGKKGDAQEDLLKAAWYCKRAASNAETDEILADPETMTAIREAQEAEGWTAPTPVADLPVRLEAWSGGAEDIWYEESTITVRYIRTGEDDPYPTATWTEYASGEEFTETVAFAAAKYFGRQFPMRYALKVPAYDGVVEEGIQLKDFAKPGDVLFLVEV